MPIYNFVSSVENPVTWGEFLTLNVIYGKKYPLMKSVWCICFKMTTNTIVNNLQKFFYHYLVAFVMDTASLCIGQRPR